MSEIPLGEIHDGENEAPPESGETTAASGNEDNRRRHERVPVRFALIAREGERRVGTIEDISAGGLRIRLDDEVSDSNEIREWTGRKGADNKEYSLQQLVGSEFTLTIHYLTITMGAVKARLIRVIRIMKHLYFAMQFTDADPAVVTRIMDLVKRRAG